jgi:hypothetical protein
MRGWLSTAPEADLLTLDHVPPRSRGGEDIVLTCRECNSQAGHELDAHLDAAEDAFDFVRATMDSPRRFKLSWGDLRINVDVQADRQGIRVFGLPRNNAPGALATWEEDFAKAPSGDQPAFKFDLSAKRRFRYQAARVAWLKSAYLVAFAAF